MTITIRQECINDYDTVFEIIESAFAAEEQSDHKEQFLVERLRKSESFIPELSLVAEIDSKIVGHILLTKISILDNDNRFQSLALAPVSVKPAFQKQGVGSKLILESHRIAKRLGYESIIVLGHEDYYPKFGYELTEKYNIILPFDVPKENCMIISLKDAGLKRVKGVVQYPNYFFG